MTFPLPLSTFLPTGANLLVIGTFLLVFDPTSAAAQPFGTGRTIATTPDGAKDVIAADVDGDGDLDVLSASSNDNTVAWYRNGDANGGGDGSSWTKIDITTTADHATGVAAADVDGDGDTDVLSASTKDNTVAWYRNGDAGGGGDGSNWTTTVITEAAEGARDVAAADVDGDGDPDVLSAAFRSGTIAWHQNGDDGSAWTTTTISAAAKGALSVQPADVDGDGDVDVLSAAGRAGSLSWHQNGDASGEGNGSSWTTTHVANLAGANSVVAKDLIGNGSLDVAGGGFEMLAWYRNDRSEGTKASWMLSEIGSANGANGTNKVLAPDLDDDGDADLLSVNMGGDTIAWYRNGDASGGGTGSGWTSRIIARPAEKARSVDAADLDGDGDLDVLACDDAKITWFENRRK